MYKTCRVWVPVNKTLLIFLLLHRLATCASSKDFFLEGQAKCPPGQYKSAYSEVKQTLVCLDCPVGTYGDTFGLDNASCSALCPAGRFGDSPGQRSASCSGICSPGYYCPEGSTSPREKHCSSNAYYCPAGSGDKILVSPGYYSGGGHASGITREYQVECEKGHYCENGVRYKCPAGTYGRSAGLSSRMCSGNCPKGYYSLEGAAACTKCPPGTFGNATGLTSPNCSGLCEPGYYCPADTDNISPKQHACAAGSFGKQFGLTTKECSIECDVSTGYCASSSICHQGYYCPEASTSSRQNDCGGSNRFCPPGSVNYTIVTPGFYTIGENDLIQENLKESQGERNVSRLNQVAQVKCQKGTFCDESGIKKLCPGGTFGDTEGLKDANCSGVCEAGYYCPEASTSRRQHRCGSVDKYCPEGSETPLMVSAGYYTVGGTVSTRYEQKICEKGYYCVEGIRRQCPAGTYGSTSGLTSKECSGICKEGHYCPKGSTKETEAACPGGTYGDVKGLPDEHCSGLCDGGYFCPIGSTSPREQKCSAGTNLIPEEVRVEAIGEVVGKLYGLDNGVYGHIPRDVVYCPRGSAQPKLIPAGYVGRGGTLGSRSWIAKAETDS